MTSDEYIERRLKQLCKQWLVRLRSEKEGVVLLRKGTFYISLMSKNGRTLASCITAKKWMNKPSTAHEMIVSCMLLLSIAYVCSLMSCMLQKWDSKNAGRWERV